MMTGDLTDKQRAQWEGMAAQRGVRDARILEAIPSRAIGSFPRSMGGYVRRLPLPVGERQTISQLLRGGLMTHILEMTTLDKRPDGSLARRTQSGGLFVPLVGKCVGGGEALEH